MYQKFATHPSKRSQNRGRSIHRVVLACTIAALAAPVFGADLNWDANIFGTPAGGTGVWDTTSLRWLDGATNVLWNNTIPDNAIFGGTGGTVSLGESITAGTVTLNSTAYVIDLNGFNLTINGSVGGASGSISTTSITNTGAIATLTTGGVSNASGPRLTGNLNVVYTGGAWNPAVDETFTGTLSLIGTGTIRSDGVALGSSTGLVRLGGTHTLQMGTAGSQFRTFTRDIELLNNTTSFTTGGVRTLTLAGSIIGGGEFRQSGSQGAIVLAGNNTYSGSTYLTGAGLSLIAGSNTAFGQSTVVETRGGAGGSGTASTIGFQGNITIGNTATIGLPGGNVASGLGSLQNFSGDNTFGGNIVLGFNTPRVFGVNPDSSLKLTGVISDVRGFTKVGNGTLILTGKNTYGGSTSAGQGWTAVNGGSLRLDFSQAEAGHDVDILNFNNSSNTAATYLSLGGGTLEIKGREGATNSQRFKNNGTAGLGFTINPGASRVVAIQNGALDLSANFGQVNTRNVGGTVKFTLPASGSFALPTGTLPTGVGGEIITANGAAFMTVGDSEWAARDGSNNIVPGSGIVGFHTSNGATSLSGNVDMSSGTDTVLASSATVTSLRFNAPAMRTINVTGQTLATGGILVTPAVGSNPSTITGGTLTGATGTANQDLVIFQNNVSGELAIGSTIADNGNPTGLTKSGAGTLALSSANTYTGTTVVNEGVLKLTNATAIPGGIDSTVGAGEGNVAFNGGVIGLTAASGDFNRALGTGAGQVRFIGSGGFAAYGGDRVVNIGGLGASVSWNNSGFVPTMSELILNAPGADGTLTFQNPINLLPGAASPISRTVRVGNGLAAVDAKLAGVLSAEGGFIKTGPGTLEVSAANTYTGPTVIDEGDVIVSGSLAAGSPVAINSDGTLRVTGSGKVSGPITINSGGTLTGSSIPATGRSFAAITMNSGGTIEPGVAVGVTNSGAATFNGGELALEITDAVNFDQLNVTGALSLNGSVALTLSLAGTLANDTLITIIDNDGTDPVNLANASARFTFNSTALEEGSVFTVTGAFGSQQFQISYVGGSGNDVVLEAVPEPGSLGFLFGCLVPVLGLARRRPSFSN